jgi:hypothetical protein
MARLYLYRDKLRHNFQFLRKKFKAHNIDWAIVTKLLCGNKKYLQEVLELNPSQVCDSRISNLKAIKEIRPNVETIYIKPPATNIIKSLVRYADISFNTEYLSHVQDDEGVTTTVADRRTGVVVGATAVGPHGGEVLGLLSAAVHGRMRLDELRRMTYAFPTFHGGVGEAIGAYARALVQVLDPDSEVLLAP